MSAVLMSAWRCGPHLLAVRAREEDERDPDPCSCCGLAPVEVDGLCVDCMFDGKDEEDEDDARR